MSTGNYIHSLTVRFSDVDMLGHTNNASYFSFMEEARIFYLKKLGYDAKDYQSRCPIILVEASCRYKAPSFVGDTLDIHLWVSEMKEKSFTMDYEIKDQKTQKLIALAKSTQVTYDYANKKVISMPSDLKQKIESLEGRRF